MYAIRSYYEYPVEHYVKVFYKPGRPGVSVLEPGIYRSTYYPVYIGYGMIIFSLVFTLFRSAWSVFRGSWHGNTHLPRITSYNVCYTKLLRPLIFQKNRAADVRFMSHQCGRGLVIKQKISAGIQNKKSFIGLFHSLIQTHHSDLHGHTDLLGKKQKQHNPKSNKYHSEKNNIFRVRIGKKQGLIFSLGNYNLPAWNFYTGNARKFSDVP